MTTSVAFLVAAVVLSVVGCALLLLRQRKPTSLESGIESFNKEMEALAPGGSPVVAERAGTPEAGSPPPAGDAAEGGR